MELSISHFAQKGRELCGGVLIGKWCIVIDDDNGLCDAF
jgi:hypothetical protein